MKPMKLIALAVSALMAGCVTMAEKVAVPVESDIVVTAKCKVQYPEKPQPIKRGSGLYTNGTAVLTDLEAQRWYAKELEKALAKCADSL